MADCKTVFLSEIGDIVTGNTPKTSDEENYASNDIPFLKPSDFCNDAIDLENIEFFISEKARTKARILPVGSIAVTCIGIIGKTKVIHDECAFNQQINAIIPYENNYNRYIAYAIAFQKELLQLQANSAVVPIINKTDFSKISIPLPPLETQRQIAANLDKVTHTIDLCNAILEKLDLLFKSRFVEMFGGIHDSKLYQYKSVNKFSDVVSGGTPSRDTPEYWNNGNIPWVKTTELQNCVIEQTEEYITEKGLSESSAKIVPPNTVIIAMYGQGKTRGMTGILNISASTNQACACILPSSEINPIYLWAYFILSYDDLRSLAKGGNQPNLNGNMIKNYPVLFPPLELQEQFAAFVEQTDKSKLAVKQVLEKAETLKKALMQEYFG